MESRTKKSLRNVLTGFGNKILTFILAFATRTIFIRLLGAEYTGINGLYTNILTVLSLADLGLVTVLSYRLYKSILQEDKAYISALIAYYRKLYTVIGCIILGIGLAIIPFLGYIINSTISQDKVVLYYVLFLLNTTVSYFYVYKTILLEADQNQYITNIAMTITTIVMYVLQIVYLLIVRDYTGYLVIQLLCTFGRNFVLSKIAEKRYPYIRDIKNADQTQINKKEMYSDVRANFIYKIGTVLLNNTDNILISVIVSTIAVGYYSNYYLLIQYIGAYVYALCTGLTASIGNLNAEQNKEKSYSMFCSTVLLFSGIACVCTTVFACCVQDFIPLWIGDEYVLDYNCVVAILLSFYFSTMNTPNYMFRETMGLFKDVQYIMIPTVIINIVLSIILGKIMGIAGIIYATSISKVVTQQWYEPFVLYKKEFHSPFSDYIVKQVQFLFSTALSVCICFMLSSLIGTGIMSLIAKALGSIIISITIWYVINRKNEGMPYLVQKIHRTIRKAT